MTAEEQFRQFCEGRLAITVAGGLAMQRAQQGSAAGWRRVRSRKELTAFHEAGHALVAAAVDFNVHTVFIIPVSESGATELFAGACVSSLKSAGDAPNDVKHPKDMDRDSKTAARLCFDLAWVDALSKPGTVATWKDALAYYRRAKARAREIINRHRYALINLAEEIERRGNLNRAEVAGILARAGL